MRKLNKPNPAKSSKCRQAAKVYHSIAAQILVLEDEVTGMTNLDWSKVDDHLDSYEKQLEEVIAKLTELDIAQIEQIKSNLKRDYLEMKKLLQFFEVIFDDGFHLRYKSDYGKLSGQNLKLPLFEEILSKLKPEHLRQYLKMEREGMEPKLQITPIALKISTLMEKIDAKRGQMPGKTSEIQCDINEDNLLYDPTEIRTTIDGSEFQVQVRGGISKSKWIEENEGFLVEIVPMAAKLKLVKDPKQGSPVQDVQVVNWLGKIMPKIKDGGYTPMTVESYLVAQMRALKSGGILDPEQDAFLMGANSKEGNALTYGTGAIDAIFLSDEIDANSIFDSATARFSVRIK